MIPIWTPIWGVQLGSKWVPYGLAHVNDDDDDDDDDDELEFNDASTLLGH